MSRPRLWVTGLGLVTPLGWGAEANWARLVRGDRGLRPVSLFDAAGQRTHIAGEVEGVRVPAGGWSRTSAMAAYAAEEALASAAVSPRERRVGLVVGGTTSGMFETEQLLARLHAEPGSREALADMLSHPLTAVGDRLHETLGPFARVRSVSSACSSGATALVVGAGWLLSGEVDIVLAGGADALCRLTFNGFSAIAALDSQPCRPFDLRRRGTNLGEGAGFLVLERQETAMARGARPVAELAGWAAGSEAHHITNPSSDGGLVASIVGSALRRAGITASTLDYVNAHGTGTPLNDIAEARGLRRALGPEVHRIPVSSSKGQIGHTLGAAGAIEAAITALVVARGMLVPTAGLEEPDPELGLTHVQRVGRDVGRVRAALSSAFGFGGMDTVLAFTEVSRGARTAVGLPVTEPDVRPPADARSPRGVIVTGVAAYGPFGLLDGAACAALAVVRTPVDLPVDPDAFLDLARARRLDRAARLGSVAAVRALGDASPAPTGLVLGNAFGNVDACAAFMHRIFDKGPRAASPSEFPNLVPSSPVGHISIYLGAHGPAFATADLAASGESAVVQAVQLIASGEAGRIVAGAVEPESDIVRRVLAALFAHAPSQARAERADLAAVVVVEAEESAKGRPVLARVRQVFEWREDPGRALANLEAPPAGGEVVLPRANGGVEAVLAQTSWRSCPRVLCSPGLGESEALGAAALAMAVGRIAAREATGALVVGLARGRGYAIVLGA